MKTITFFRSKLFALTFALMASVSSFAYDEMPDFQVDGLYYNFLEGDNVEVTHPYIPVVPVENVASNTKKKSHAISADDYYNLTNLVIPSTVTYEGKVYNVTRIGFDAFNQCDKLTFVDIPSSVKTIGVGAFYFCSSLTSITLKEGLEYIEWNAFEDCRSLENITFPNSLKTIGNYAFSNTLWYKNQPNGAVYAGNVFYKYKGDIPQNTSFVIKEGTVSISPYAFVKENYHEDYSLVSVSIPNSVEVIGEGAFYRCRALTSIVIPDGVTTIETLAFHYCKALKSVTCEAVNPPALSGSVFLSTPIADATLYVPAESIEAYKTATEWKDFGQILPIEPTSYKSQWCDTWNVMWFDGMRFDETASTSQYRLGKDTIIGDYTYSKFIPGTFVRFTNDRKVYVYHEYFDDHDPYSEDLPTGEYLAYDFSAQVGDTLEVFSGIGTYSTYPCVVDDVQIDSETNLRTMTLHKICRIDEDEYDDQEITWIEGVGSPEGFLISYLPCGWVGGGTYALLCAHKGDDLKYTGSLYDEYGCEYNAGVVSDDLFPTLSGLQRTICREYYEQADNKTRMEQFTNLTTRTETGGPYIYCSPFLLREKDNKILIYSRSLNKDLVLYDFNLQVGDSLPMLYIDFFAKDDWIADSDMEIWCVVDYHKDLEGNILPADTLIVTDVSMITLLDGKEYKKWTFNNGMEYVEGIGNFGNRQWSGDFFQLIANRDVPTSLQGERLVCASRNGQLLYQMDDAEMERLGAECLCEAENPEDLFPTLWGLQRTGCTKTIGENENGTVWGSRSYLMQGIGNTIIDGKQYVLFGTNNIYDEYCSLWLREENNKILVYSTAQKKDLVLYDFTLNVGDSLPRLYVDEELSSIVDYFKYEADWEYTKPLFVTEVSTITLLDGKEYKKWTFDNGIEYVEGIGSFGSNYGHNDFYQLIVNAPRFSDVYSQHLVCTSRNGQLLYQMDASEMEQLETECLCEAENPEDLFPTLWGLQRTVCNEYCGETEDDNSANNTYQQTFERIFFENDKSYILCSGYLLREEDNMILIYSQTLNKDLVLYDFTLEVGDSLLALYINAPQWDPPQSEDIIIVTPPYNGYVVDHDYNGKPDPVVVTDISTVTLLDGKEYKKWTFNNGMEYVEGIGSFGNGQWSGDLFQLIANKDVPTCLLDEHLVCASKNGQLLYQMDDAEMEQLETECLCEAENPEDLFPTLWGLQRTVCYEYCGETEDDNSDNITYKQTFTSISFENNKPYILCSGYLLREESNKILLYSESLNKEIVLYDFTLEVGDSLPAYKEHFDETIYPADTLVVTDVSYVTLLDGKEYKKWTFNNGMEYAEGFGMYGGHRNGNFVGLIKELVVPCHTGTHLVCVSKNGKLLYQMDDAEMERLGAECLCDYDRGPLKDNAKNGKIGGRPTPTQWNQLELDLREMENGNTILRAETFSYTLENDSIVANGKTFYQLARQSTKDTATTKSFVGALHFSEDEDNRVYFLRDGEEYVLYDFTAEPGDTIEIFAGINNYPQDSTYTHVVTGKDTLENGACRMLLEVVFPDETATAENAEKVWLAGLGSVDGIVHNAATRATTVRSSDTQTSVMLCAWRDDNCLYTTDHPDYNTLGCVYNIDEMTSVEDTHSSLPMTDCYKLLRNGQLLIIHKGKTYNVLGVPVE